VFNKDINPHSQSYEHRVPLFIRRLIEVERFFFQEETDGRRHSKMAFDELLVHLGEFGRYQKRIYILLCLPAISCALHKLAWVFLAARAPHRFVYNLILHLFFLFPGDLKYF
jgi:hypothetical protein